ncbi:BofC C-terminal domain-containing protein [Paenibacillus donghaensis]|uniref:BofC C-terminal domain-containing protein n=1 Tax=Paenibacillus donghaensis TaxID=414771 RepID=UPI0012FD42C6|nr:BofC C-terminal domain-containing protein [Paenibacillus donghaensis]
MNAFRLKKQLWRRWRRWKKALWIGAACLGLTFLAWRSLQVPEEISELLNSPAPGVTESLDHIQAADEPAAAVFKQDGIGSPEADPAEAQEQLLQAIEQSGQSRTVHLKITYVTGEEIQTLAGRRNPQQQKQLIVEHAAWSGRIGPEGDLWLEQRVNDLSPLTKREAYIGVDEQGNLTLFKGPPVDQKVMKTFFQMDMGSMKSALPEEIWNQLQDGIRVQDIEEYNSVLSTFSDYARDTAEQVMQSKE